MAENKRIANVRIFLLMGFYVRKSPIGLRFRLLYLQNLNLVKVMSGFEVLATLGVLAGVYFWNLYRAAGNLVFFPGNITGFSLNGLSPTIQAEMIVQNTNNISFTVMSIAASVSSNGTMIGNVSNFSPFQIPGNSQATIPLTLVLQPIALVNNIIGIITGGVGGSEIQITGSLNADGIQAPISLTYKIGI